MAQWFPLVWAILALVFIVAEIFTVGFFIICFGVGAAAAAIVALMGFSTIGQMLVFVIVSAIAVVTIRPIAARVSGHGENHVGIDRVLHQVAVVTHTIDPLKAQGRVRVEREEWLADTVEDTPDAVGTKVEVVAVEGTRLKVRPLG
ncbi:MAG: NfeD family protein [Caldilineaceae bacterium]|nr:NfeD family protein [Caldilineaceae bacterium]